MKLITPQTTLSSHRMAGSGASRLWRNRDFNRRLPRHLDPVSIPSQGKTRDGHGMTHLVCALLLLCLPLPALAMGDGMYTLSVADVERAVAEAIVSQNVSPMAEATLEGAPRDTAYAHTAPLGVAVKALQADASTRRWAANINFISGAQVVSVVPMQGRFTEMVMLPSVNRQITAGETISDADVAMTAFPLTMARQNIVRNSQDIIGKVAYRAISANRPVRTEEFSSPQVVKKNKGVTISYNTPAMSITTQGQALENGAVGDVIQVVNVNSKKVIRATVVDADHVRVSPPQLASAGGQHASN